MPLVRIEMRQGKPAEYRQAIADGVHGALVETVNVPADDLFQIIGEHAPDQLRYDPRYLGIARTDDIVIVQITFNVGRSVELKKRLYAGIVERLARNPGVRPQDVFVNLLEVPRENWSFGNGEAQYAS